MSHKIYVGSKKVFDPVDYDVAGAAAAAVASHKAEASPHEASDVGADPAGTATNAVANHVAASDPHTQYLKEADLTAENIGNYPMSDPAGYFPGDDKLLTQMQSVGSQLAAIADRVGYGVMWTGTSGTNSLVRLGAAVGRVFTATVDTTIGQNNFEDIAPWSDCRVCNLADNGTINAYEGEPTFARDGTNGQVMLEIPKYWYKRIVGDSLSEEIWVSPVEATGYAVHPAFICNGTVKEKIYIGVYMGAEESTKLVSKTGVLPQYNKTISQFRALGRARGTGWGIMDLTSLNALEILMTVMAANWNAQTTIGRGVVDMPYTSSHTAVVAETAANRIVVTNAVAANYLAGYQIGIGTSTGGNQIAMQRTITSIAAYDASNMAINFDGAAVNIAVGNILYSMPGKTGGADALGRHTGRAAGTDGKTEINVLGLQGMWGNWWQFVDGVNMDSSYYLWVNDDLATHQSDLFVAPYVKLSWPVASAEGYVRRFGHDPAAPWVFAPSEVGGSSDAPFGDYFYRSAAPANRIVMSGGAWIYGSVAGPWSRYVPYASSFASWDLGARLLYKP